MEKLYFTPQQAEEIKELLDLRLTTSDKNELKKFLPDYEIEAFL